MKVEMVMPQMGESIAEGTILKWRKGVGDSVVVDEDILEISTDKVDTEIPSPATGKIAQILVQEGATVAIKTLLAIIETDATAAATPQAAAPQATAPAATPPASTSGTTAIISTSGTEVAASDAARGAASDVGIQGAGKEAVGDTVVVGRPSSQESSPHDGSAEGGFVIKEFKRHSDAPAPAPATVTAPAAAPAEKTSNFLSPLVQRIMADEGVSMTELNSMVGTGQGGRVTKQDVLGYVAQRKAQPEPRALPPAPLPDAKVISKPTAPSAPAAAPSGSVWVGANDTVVEMDRMRRAIADHMVRSVHTSPHVVSFTEVDMSRIVRHREKNKDSFKAQEGVNLTYTSYLLYCTAKALKEFPYVNASVDGYNMILRKQINLGFAVELPGGGLIVPVIKGVDALSLTGVARGLNDLAEKARSSRLDPNDVTGGTFTVTNVGVFGNVAGAPIINQPQVAILGTGAIKKRPVVIETPEGDVIGIKPIMVMSLSYDHRIIDGAMAGRFMARLAQVLEAFEG